MQEDSKGGAGECLPILEKTYGGDVMDGVQERLREERLRLGLSQAEFGKIGGVKKLTQLKYEKGDSDPDSGYLRAIGKAGADVAYIVLGLRSTEDSMRADALQYIIDSIGEKLGLHPSALQVVADLAFEHREMLWKRGQDLNTFKDIGPLIEILMENSNLLWGIYWVMEEECTEDLEKLSPDQKARTVVLLYRAFKGSGNVDSQMVKEAVALAAG